MKIRQALKNKKFVLAVVGSTLIATAGVSALSLNQSTGADEEPPIVQEVRSHGEQLDNHEARLDNAENDITDLQDNTGTAPSSNRAEVPNVATPRSGSISALPSVAPVTVADFLVIPLGNDNFDCKYTYTDGSTRVFSWKTTNPQGAWVTDSNGNNGHWVATTNTVGSCSSKSIGKVKP